MLRSVDDARLEILRHFCAGAWEQTVVDRASGRVLSHDAHATRTLPSAPLSIMDGYALGAAGKSPGVFEIVDESAAGHPSQRSLRAGEAARISTGAVLVAGAGAVVPQEDVRIEGRTLHVPDPPAPGSFIRPAGSDIAAGVTAVPRGQHLGPLEIAALRGCGVESVRVHARPRVAIVCTGDELVAPGETPGPGQLVNTNAGMLAAQVLEAGGTPVMLAVAPDDPNATAQALRAGLAHDMLVTSGGISVGPHDLVLPTLRELGAQIHVHKVAVRPGKPLTFATCGNTPVFALPGNPASTFVTFEIFVRPTIRTMLGANPWRPTLTVALGAAAARMKTREHFVRAKLVEQRAVPVSTQVSGNLRSLVGVDLLLHLQPGIEPAAEGEFVSALLLPQWWPHE